MMWRGRPRLFIKSPFLLSVDLFCFVLHYHGPVAHRLKQKEKKKTIIVKLEDKEKYLHGSQNVLSFMKLHFTYFQFPTVSLTITGQIKISAISLISKYCILP